MRTTSFAARGRPLAALLLLILVSLTSWAAWADAAVQVHQEIDLEEIFVAGMGEEPLQANLTLLLQGLGPPDGYPVDCVLLVDTSATADLITAKAFAFDLIDQFSAEDRIALVSYATTARLDVPLTENRTELKTAIGDLASGGKSALGLAMQMARRELLNNGREDAILVEILLADGQSNIGIDPDIEGEIASESGITIVSIGIGPLINRSLMELFAGETDGLFFQRPSERALTQIFEHLVIDIAATDIRVEKRLPAGLRFVSASPGPSQVETLSDGTTSMVWRVAELLLGQELAIEVEIEAIEKGVWDTDVDSLVTYADFRGVEGSVHVPPLMLLAIEPNRVPVAMFAYEPEGATTVDTVTFTSLSFDPEEDGRIVSWEWDFGDGSVGSEQNPRHRYAESGAYTVRMRVIDNHGAVSPDAVAHVNIGDPPPPVALFDYTPAAPTTADTVAFIDQSFHPEEDVEIGFWEWDFGDGSISAERNPGHRFSEKGTFEVRLTVIDKYGATSEVHAVEVAIGNTPPYASFSTRATGPGDVAEGDILTSDQPRVGVEILLDASGSYDLDDSIEWYMWDFDGDGIVDKTTKTSEVDHAFNMPGEHRVVLIVVDGEGAQATVEKTLNVIASVTTSRTIESGLPDDWTISCGVVHVTLNLGVNTTVNGLSVTETIPAGWAFTEVENDGATIRRNGQTIEWLFLEKFVADDINSQREIHYTLTAADTVGEMQQSTIRGTLASSSPRFKQTIAGEDRVTVTPVLPVTVVISRWDVVAAAVDLHLGETIGFDQIQYAVSLWLSGDAVPLTGDLTIGLTTMQDLIAYWLTGSSVHDPLP